MEQYIPKSVLLAELNRKKIPFKRDVEDGNYPTYLCAIMDFEDYINSLEVKEVDLDKEMNEALTHLTDKDMRGWFRYFFALGLRIQKGEEV